MDMLNIIQSVGFPIAMVVAMGAYLKYITDQHREDRNTADSRHRDEIHEVTEALNNNTLAIQKLTDYITFGGDGNDQRD